MKEILRIDLKNYDENAPLHERWAAKGIFLKDGKMLMLRSSQGDLKFIGGGIEAGEDPMDCLKREYLEETGFRVLDASIEEIGVVVERRKDRYENAVWQLTTYLYYCEADLSRQFAPALTENERKLGMGAVWASPEEALRANENCLKQEVCNPWVYREVQILKMLFKG